MKNKIGIIVLGVILNLSLFSQPLVFEREFDWSSHDVLYDFIPTGDQGFVVLGISGNQSFVMKLDQNGDMLWKKNIGPGSNTYYNQIIQSQNSDLLITGNYFGDAILLRLNNNGDSISSIHYPYTLDDNSFIGVVELENNDLIISERREQDNGNYPPRVFLRGFNSAGNLNWSQEIGDEHYPYNMILTENNNLVVTGINEWGNGTKIWISKYDSLGSQLTDTIMSGSRGNQIIESSNGYLYAAVDGYSTNGNYKAVKLDSDCVLEWKLNNNNEFNHSNTICQLEPNLFAVGGSIQDSLIIIIFNEDGDSISSFTYNEYYSQDAKRMFVNETSLTVGGIIKSSSNNRSILVFQVLLDSLYTSNNSSLALSYKTKPNIYPNPANNIINLSDFQVTGEPMKVIIYNVNGDLKHMKQFESGDQLKINIELLSRGYYIAQIITRHKTDYCKFIIKD